MNNYMDKNASFQDDSGLGIMFETYGEEYEFVASLYEEGKRVVWSYRDDEYEDTIIVQGMSNSAIGYFVTEVPWETTDNFIVRVGE